MSRTTGFTATATVNILLNNIFTKKGVFPPELLGQDKQSVNYLKEYLKERKILM